MLSITVIIVSIVAAGLTFRRGLPPTGGGAELPSCGEQRATRPDELPTAEDKADYVVRRGWTNVFNRLDVTARASTSRTRPRGGHGGRDLVSCR